MSQFTCKVCQADLGWDRPSGVCSSECLRKAQGFPPTVETGGSSMGLRWARCGDWRLVAYAAGGACEQHFVSGSWCLMHDKGTMPADVRALLQEALKCA